MPGQQRIRFQASTSALRPTTSTDTSPSAARIARNAGRSLYGRWRPRWPEPAALLVACLTALAGAAVVAFMSPRAERS